MQSCHQTCRSWRVPGLHDTSNSSSIKEFASTLLCPASIHHLSAIVTSAWETTAALLRPGSPSWLQMMLCCFYMPAGQGRRLAGLLELQTSAGLWHSPAIITARSWGPAGCVLFQLRWGDLAKGCQISVIQDTNTWLPYTWILQWNCQPGKCDMVSHAKNPFSQRAVMKQRFISTYWRHKFLWYQKTRL